MSNTQVIVALAVGSLLVSGCSTRPRNFTANLSAPVNSRESFEKDFRVCEQLVRHGQRSGFRSAAAGVAAGAGVLGAGLAVGGAVGAGTVGTGWSAIGAGAGAAAAAATVFVGAAGFGLSRLIRGGRERRYKQAMGDCLSEFGYEVHAWERIDKRQDAAARAASNAVVSALASPEASAPAEPTAVAAAQ